MRRRLEDRAAGRRAGGTGRNNPAAPASEGVGPASEGIGPAKHGAAAFRSPIGGLEGSASAPAGTRRTKLV